jgi:hypothetical protein
MTTSESTIDRALRSSLFIAAARIGRNETVRYLYAFNRMEVLWEFGQSDHEPERSGLDECLDTPSLDVWKFVYELHDIYAIPLTKFHYNMGWSLRKRLKAGNIVMVQHLLEQGAIACDCPVWHGRLVKDAPFNQACKGGIARILP